ncbi:MAG: M48 family metallopeptidase, partial [Planctomycetota bacterium]
MERVGYRLAIGVPDLRGEYRFRLLGSDRVNAISLPGGYIYITRGLYGKLSSDDLMAAALAHEMAHLASKDHFKARPGEPHRALEKELSADTRAARYLDAAGMSPAALANLVLLIKDAQPPGWAEVRTANL